MKKTTLLLPLIFFSSTHVQAELIFFEQNSHIMENNGNKHLNPNNFYTEASGELLEDELEASSSAEKNIVEKTVSNRIKTIETKEIALEESKYTTESISYDDCKPKQIGFSESYIGVCIDSLPSGKGMSRGAKGVYNGEFRNGLFHGKGKIESHIIRNSYEGNFVNGKKQGAGYIYDPASRTNRLAEFENDNFVNWKEEAVYASNIYNVTQTERYFKSNNLFVGKKTKYGNVVGIDTNRNIVQIESISYDDNGHARMEVQFYPLSYFSN